MMTTFERRQRILALLREQSGVKVTELAPLLDVSEGTIRNDLTALEEAGQLRRVRGGAVPKDNHDAFSPTLPDRARINAPAKQRIARWAADMVQDGDSILLDASTTVFHMVPFLQDHQNLTIFTNGLETARALAKNPANTIILLGGVLRQDGTSVTGHLGEKILKDLHINTAFVSCSGFSVEAGLTQFDLQEAQLKSHMIECAKQVVALIDASKFGQASLTPFATVDQLSHIVTDSQISPTYIEQLRQTEISFTICGENTASSFSPAKPERPHYRIGFANLGEDVPFAVDVRHGLERAAKQAGNIDLVLADNQLNGKVAQDVANRLIGKEIDLAIEYQIDEKVGSLIMNKFQQANIPVIAVDIPIVGASFVGANNYQSGYMAGEALGQWIKKQWHGQLDRLIVLEEPRAGALPAARIQGQLDGVQAVVGEIPADQVTHLESGNRSDISERRMIKALNKWPDEHHLAVVSFNDDAALGALLAARKTNREEDVAIVGQGADRMIRPEIRRPNSRVIGSTAYMPEKYGDKLIELALKILRGEPVPPAVYTDHTFITAENIDLFYPE
jgi:ribose transport system substrate-binding protein